MLQVRSDANDLPEAGEPVDFDQPPFVTHGLGPAGETHYNARAGSGRVGWARQSVRPARRIDVPVVELDAREVACRSAML